jgi:hypothetical protein
MRKGEYSIITTFFFVAVMIAVVLTAIIFTSQSTLLRSRLGTDRFQSTLAQESYEAIVACHGGTVLTETRVMNCTGNRFTKAYKFEQPALDGCPLQTWNDVQFAAAQNDTTSNVFVYWVALKQAPTGRVCLARLSIMV